MSVLFTFTGARAPPCLPNSLVARNVLFLSCIFGENRGAERTTATARVAVACEALYRVLRELPLQVGPDGPGGTAFCTRSWQFLRSSVETVLARSSRLGAGADTFYRLRRAGIGSG